MEEEGDAERREKWWQELMEHSAVVELEVRSLPTIVATRREGTNSLCSLALSPPRSRYLPLALALSLSLILSRSLALALSLALSLSLFDGLSPKFTASG